MGDEKMERTARGKASTRKFAESKCGDHMQLSPP